MESCNRVSSATITIFVTHTHLTPICVVWYSGQKLNDGSWTGLTDFLNEVLQNPYLEDDVTVKNFLSMDKDSFDAFKDLPEEPTSSLMLKCPGLAEWQSFLDTLKQNKNSEVSRIFVLFIGSKFHLLFCDRQAALPLSVDIPPMQWQWKWPLRFADAPRLLV